MDQGATTMTFAWPWLLALIIAPLTLVKFKLQYNDNQTAIDHPYLASIATRPHEQKKASYLSARTILIFLTWTLLIIAVARPQWLGEPTQQQSIGRSVMLSVDISGSMGEKDMIWNNRRIARYQAVQAVVGDFALQRRGDFLGLVVFGSFADIQAPLTPDVDAVKDILVDLLPGMAGDSTAIGDGLALAVQRLRDIDTEQKVIVLLSDGENLAGSVTPLEAAEIAKQSNIRVHTIGFGGQGSVFFGDTVDSETLSEIAQSTGGQFFRATSTNELESVFSAIEALEPTESEQQEQRIVSELFFWPLALAMFFTLCLCTPQLWLREGNTQ
jgi:Ca-activated chloride channel family protein